MKTITIPKRFGYPTLNITINGKEYTVKSGVEITVEDSVAEAVENALKLEPKPGRNKSRLAQRAEESLTEITTEDLEGITIISNCAFYSCKSLVKVTIPNAITKIGDSAFDWCWSLESVFLPEIPPTITKTSAFGNIKANCVFYCKTQESLNAYTSAPIWSTLAGTYSFVVEE